MTAARRLRDLATIQATAAADALVTISDPDIRSDIIWTSIDRAVDDVRQAIDHAAGPATPQETETLLESAGQHLDTTIETLPPECLIP